jgi:non-ribosomal peptide synthetase component F
MKVPAGSPSTIVSLFEAQAARTPDAPAVAAADARLSYAELDARATALAGRLTARGVGPEQVVAVAVPSSALAIVALLGVLKAGAAYLPVDVAYPARRIAFMLADARPAALITTAQAAAGLTVPDPPPPAGLVLLDETALAEPALDETALAEPEQDEPAPRWPPATWPT